MMRKGTKKLSIEFSFSNVVIERREGILYAYFLTNDHEKNKEVDWIIKDMGYTRNRLVKEYPLQSLKQWREYNRLGIYISNEHLEEMKQEKERRASIRKWVLSNIK